jgi:lysozyme
MKIGKAGLDLIREFEGLELKAYKDAVGIWTVGFGHTAAAGPPKPVAGLVITEQEAVDILTRDLGKYEAGVSRALKRTPSQNQFDAMVSLCYNIGEGAFAGSSVVRYFNAGDFEMAAGRFLLWNKAKGKVLKGLTRRREAERKLFLTPDSAKDSPAPPSPPDAADFKEDLAEERLREKPAPAHPAGFWAWLKSLFG